MGSSDVTSPIVLHKHFKVNSGFNYGISRMDSPPSPVAGQPAAWILLSREHRAESWVEALLTTGGQDTRLPKPFDCSQNSLKIFFFFLRVDAQKCNCIYNLLICEGTGISGKIISAVCTAWQLLQEHRISNLISIMHVSLNWLVKERGGRGEREGTK